MTADETRSVTILGTIHEIQGAQKRTGNIDDPDYPALVKKSLQGNDFLFEEASQLGPTIAERLAEESLGSGRYLDVDIHTDDRLAHDIYKTGASPIAVNPDRHDSAFYRQEFEEEHAIRESYWLTKIRETDSAHGLFICGYLHALSFGRRLREVEFGVKTLIYVPFCKVCQAQSTRTP